MCWKLRVYSRIFIFRGGEGWRFFCNLNLLFSGATRGGVYFDAQLVSASSPDKNSLQCLDVLCIKGSSCSHQPTLSDLVEEHLANLQINTFCLFMKIHEICIDVNGDEGEDNVRKMRFWYRGFSLSHRDEMSQRKPVTLHTYS